MTPLLTKPFMMTAFFALVACGGGDDSGGGGGTPTAGTNGLDFGASGQELSDAEGTAITMRTSSFQTGSAPSIGTGTITLDAGFFDGGTANTDGTIQIFGQTVTIANGVGALTSGEEVRVTYEPNRSGTYAGALDVSVSGPGMGDINGEGAYVFGFETNPTAIAARTSGTVVYDGSFQAVGSLNENANTSTEFEGGITVTVSFVGVGIANVDIDGRLNDATDITMDSQNIGLDVNGNGFAGALECETGCAGNASSIDATFYGPDADELGGVLDFEFVVGMDGFDGVGTFVITPGP